MLIWQFITIVYKKWLKQKGKRKIKKFNSSDSFWHLHYWIYYQHHHLQLLNIRRKSFQFFIRLLGRKTVAMLGGTRIEKAVTRGRQNNTSHECQGCHNTSHKWWRLSQHEWRVCDSLHHKWRVLWQPLPQVTSAFWRTQVTDFQSSWPGVGIGIPII
jgi:hypothetical protein